MTEDSRIFVAGHRGLVGSAILRTLQANGFKTLLTRTRDALDLTRQDEVERFFSEQRPDHVFLAAAKVGGILANRDNPADFIRDNLLIQTHVIEASRRAGVKKLVFLGSSCIYPREASQPMGEKCLLTGPLETTNEPYAVAKIAGIKMVQSYRRQFGFDGICLMPTNLYGPGDNFDLESSHVIPALIRKFHEARVSGKPQVEVWGTGTPKREFLHVEDLADAAVFLMKSYSGEEIVNVGSGEDLSIADLARLIGEVVGYRGEIVFDTSASSHSAGSPASRSGKASSRRTAGSSITRRRSHAGHADLSSHGAASARVQRKRACPRRQPPLAQEI
jgi:GDP-L-fucose synthase